MKALILSDIMKTKPCTLLAIGLLILSACTSSPTENTLLSLPAPTAIATFTLAPAPATPTAVATITPITATDTPVITFANTISATSAAPTTTPAPYLEHIVQEGESLLSIAQQHGTTMEAIAAASFLANPDFISVGQNLTIPQATAVTNLALSQVTTVSTGQPTIIGMSVLGRPIEVYTFGTGINTLILVGGIHGGYEWNTTVLAYELIDYLKANPNIVPTAVTLYIIPAANPDGIYIVTGKTGPITSTDVISKDNFPARFNARGVDLNRNWDCDWSPTAYWRDQPVSGGDSPFSEIENQILRDFIRQQGQVDVVLFWHSQATLVSPGSCRQDHPPSIEMATTFARAANYPLQGFSAYEITGDASDWLAKNDIPSFSVELTTHETTDWERNREGVLALLALYQE